MYYTFYLNERMALDNWEYYDDCNWLLRLFLVKDRTKNIKTKMDFYLNHRHQYNEMDFSDDMKAVVDDYIDKKMMYEDYLEDPDGCGMVYQPFKKNKMLEYYANEIGGNDNIEMKFNYLKKRCETMNAYLREINEVVLYESDFKYLEETRKKDRLTVKQVKLLFGLIFFSRMNDCEWCRVGTSYKRKSFYACFDEYFEPEDLGVINEMFEPKAFDKIEAQNLGNRFQRYRHVEDEFDFRYRNFMNKDKVAYVFQTTLENNRLNLSVLAEQLIPNLKNKYCRECGQEFVPNSNRQCICENCREEVKRIQARERKRKSRNKEKIA